GAPYNDRCPIDPEAGVRAVTGCVATATGQIINYWEYPPSVSFSSASSYWSEITTPRIWIDAPTANISHIDYRGAGWNPDVATIADLLYACGVSLEMQYSSGGSSSDTRYVPNALVYDWDYSHADGYIIMITGFFDTLRANVLIAQPVELGIGGTSVGGHAIVCDGYDSSDLYHLNMGWGGYADGWYSLPEGMPEGFTIVGHQATNIVPPIITRRPPVNVRGKSLAGGYIDLEWGSPFNITEPVLQYKIYRRDFYATTYDLIATTHDTAFVDSTIEELTGYSYAVSANYSAGESDPVELSLYSGIIGGWARSFGGAGDQVAYSVAPAPGFGCIAVGYTSLAAGDKDGYVVRTVAGSSPLWSARIDYGGDDCLYSVVEAPDSCFVAAGATEVEGSDSDIWLVKLDDDGDTIWTRSFGNRDDETALSIAATSDGGYILAGYASDGSTERGCVVKTGSDGHEIWSQDYLDDTRFNSVCEVSSGGYILAGRMLPGPLGQSDILLVRIDSDGDTIWTKTYGGVSDDIGNSVVEAGDGGFVLAGKSRSFGMPLFYSFLISKVTSTGDSVWTSSFAGMGDFEANSVCRKLNGDFLAVGSAKISGDADVYSVEVAPDGDSVAARFYGTDGNDIGYSAVELPDSGIIIAGKTFRTDNTDVWLLKIGGDLLSPVAEDSPKRPAFLSLFAYPNPFNSAVKISIDYESESCRRRVEQVGCGPAGGVGASDARSVQVGVQIFDITGRLVADLHATNCGVPQFVPTPVIWQPEKSLSSGVYLVRAKIGDNNITKRIVYLK
ncbi:C10 family peptidase, partial [bacterium]|nr:C10 family peptidase [bacterium]